MEKNETLKLGLKLLIITAVAGLILGGAYSITKKTNRSSSRKNK